MEMAANLLKGSNDRNYSQFLHNWRVLVMVGSLKWELWVISSMSLSFSSCPHFWLCTPNIINSETKLSPDLIFCRGKRLEQMLTDQLSTHSLDTIKLIMKTYENRQATKHQLSSSVWSQLALSSGCVCVWGVRGDILKDSASLSSRRRWDFRARFTATLPGNQACFTQTKSTERAQANKASSCRALLSSRAEIWSATVKCNQGTMCKEPFCQLAKKNLHCRPPERTLRRKGAGQHLKLQTGSLPL